MGLQLVRSLISCLLVVGCSTFRGQSNFMLSS
jgi:hypothetical protein